MLGKVFIHLDPRPFALTVEPSDVIQGVDEGLDIPAALPQPLDRIGELLSSGSVILEQPIPSSQSFITSRSEPLKASRPAWKRPGFKVRLIR